MATKLEVREVQGRSFFSIFEVYAVKSNGETITSDRFLNEKDAKEHVAFIHNYLSTLYDCAFIRERWVWC